MGTEVATQSEGGKAVATYDYGAYASAGFENVTAADFKPSFLRVLQGNSPEVETIEGAKPGLIIDSVTNDLYPAVNIVPAVREHVMVAWKPRSAEGGGAGGFGGVYQLNDSVVIEACKKVKKFERGADGKLILPEINGGEFQLVETIYFHGVQALDNGGIVPVSIPFSSTGIPAAQDWFTTMFRQMIPGTNRPYPLFAHVSKLGVQKKERGTMRWWILQPSWAAGTAEASRLSPDSDLFKSAAAVFEASKSGRMDVNYEQGSTGSAEGGAAGTSDKTMDKEIPF